MTFREDPRLAEARLVSIEVAMNDLGIGGLRRIAGEFIGPCPDCGGDDRFSINVKKGVFQCRKGCSAGDVIQLVRWQKGFTLDQALEWLVGPRTEISEQERKSRIAKAEAAKKKQDEAAERQRRKAMARAREIWGEGVAAEGSDVRRYLAARGLTADLLPEMPGCLRFHASLPYMVKDASGAWVEAHRGPAMLAAVVQLDGAVSGVHRTWFDLSRPRGKASIAHDGAAQKVKKTLGSIKGGAIRLHTPDAPWDVLVMGEGIETTLTALVSGAYPGAAFWAGVSLGNIAGAMVKVEGQRWSGIPDMEAERAFYPPPWVRQLVLVEDGDSAPAETRAKMLSGARRAMALVPGLSARVVPCPKGLDLNDVLLDGDPADKQAITVEGGQHGNSPGTD